MIASYSLRRAFRTLWRWETGSGRRGLALLRARARCAARNAIRALRERIETKQTKEPVELGWKLRPGNRG